MVRVMAMMTGGEVSLDFIMLSCSVTIHKTPYNPTVESAIVFVLGVPA